MHAKKMFWGHKCDKHSADDLLSPCLGRAVFMHGLQAPLGPIGRVTPHLQSHGRVLAVVINQGVPLTA